MEKKEAMKILKEFHDNSALFSIRTALDTVIPELKESEDEKIIDAIKHGLKCLGWEHIDDIKIVDILAWLEKQGEQLPVGFYYVNSEGKKFYSDTFKYGDVIIHVEKQDEQETLCDKCRKEQPSHSCQDITALGRCSLEHQSEQIPANKSKPTEHSYITPNSKFFQWIYDRLKNVYNENPNVDYMLSLKERIEDMQKPFDYENANIQQNDFAPKSAMEAIKEEKVDNQNCVKPDKVEPKFKVGDWVASKICNSSDLLRIIDVDGKNYEVETPQGNTGVPSIAYIDNNFHLWTIQDARDGDVLATKKGNPFIYDKNRYTNGLAYYYVGLDVNKEFKLKGHHHILSHFGKFSSIFPATKEQRDLLFQKMKEAGYEWDAENKELKKIDPCSDCTNDKGCINCENGNLKETEKSAWSEEDERILNKIQDHLREFYVDKKGYPYVAEPDSPEMMENNWLKCIKNRVQPKQEWSEEDEHRVGDTIYFLETAKKHYASDVELNACIDWLKSLKDRIK